MTGFDNGLGLDLAHVVELPTRVATSGALRMTELVGDDTFELTIGVVVIVKALVAG